MSRLLRIDASARVEGSVTRELGDAFVARWRAVHADGDVVERDLAAGVPLIDGAWVTANLTDPTARTIAQREALAVSDTLVDELRTADELVLAVPLYNFGVPAALKAWIDLVCRARETFAYSETGPVGLLSDRPTTVIMASGGVPLGSEVDFASRYVEHVLGFIGITDVRWVAAERLMIEGDNALARAHEQLAMLFDNPDRAA